MTRIGIDACKGGWLVVRAHPTPGPLSFHMVSDLAPLFAEAEAGKALIAIDIPIGLSESGGRHCDAAARKLLVGRTSCVFNAPSRSALGGTTYEEASALNHAACGKYLSQQSYALLRCIAYVDHLIRPELQDRVREVHPEVTFAVLAGAPIVDPKKSARGQELRLGLLTRWGIEPDIERVRNAFGRSQVAADDVLDACAALVTAYRCADGRERVLPDGPVERDSRGLRMEIVA